MQGYPEVEQPCIDKRSRGPHCFLCQIFISIAFIIGCQSVSEGYLASESLIYLNYDHMLINAEWNFKMSFSMYFSVVKHSANTYNNSWKLYFFSLYIYMYNKKNWSPYPNFVTLIIWTNTCDFHVITGLPLYCMESSLDI